MNFSFPHGTHLCAVEVDTETGGVKMRKYTCVDDIGNIINPLIVEGQVHGGLVQGIAQALWEEAVYDDSGTLVSGVVRRLPACRPRPTRSASTSTTPRRRRPTNTLGTKGVGEAGTIASTPAVVNAVVDALRPFGVNDVRMPCTPERIWKAIHATTAPSPAVAPPKAPPHHTSTRRTRPTAGLDRTGERPVIPAQFDYLAPTTVEEALAALAEDGDDAKVIAGGQSLLPVLRMRLNAPEVVIDLGRIEALRGVRDDGDDIVIGAMTTYDDVLHDDLVREQRAA